MTVRLLLASQSPRRRELIKLVGLPYTVRSADVDESSITDPDPVINVMKTAELKAKAIASQIQMPHPATIIIAADTIVVLDQQILGKPKDVTDAQRMLTALRDRTHQVHTGMVLIDTNGKILKDVCTASVTMRRYSNEEVNSYIATGDPFDKAGAYAIQHPQFNPVTQLEGCYLGVVGLSICHLLQLLAQLNISTKPMLRKIKTAHQLSSCPILEASSV